MSDLQNKKIVNINDGKEIGIIIDITIDNEGKIINFIVEKNKFLSIVSTSKEVIVKWDEINKIGEDVILVNTI